MPHSCSGSPRRTPSVSSSGSWSPSVSPSSWRFVTMSNRKRAFHKPPWTKVTANGVHCLKQQGTTLRDESLFATFQHESDLDAALTAVNSYPLLIELATKVYESLPEGSDLRRLAADALR